MGNGGCGCAVPVLIFDHLIILFFSMDGDTLLVITLYLPNTIHTLIVHCMYDVWT